MELHVSYTKKNYQHKAMKRANLYQMKILRVVPIAKEPSLWMERILSAYIVNVGREFAVIAEDRIAIALIANS
jgi:hypothetical protein